MNSQAWFLDARHQPGRFSAVLALDASQPYLHHHRPTGEPLFGTVMGIEAMAAAAHALEERCAARASWPGAAIMLSVENAAPYLAAHDAPPLRVMAARMPGATPAVAATVMSGTGADQTMHYRCHMSFATGAAPVIRPERVRAVPSHAHAVGAGEIYEVYFHGPAYRVLAGAVWRDGRLFGRAARGLPALFGRHDAPPQRTGSRAAPRVIEFALQSAGLFAIAAGDRLLIPHRIERIVWTGRITDVDAGAWSTVSPGAGAAGGPLDIRVYDERGRVGLLVEGYHSVAPPFAVDEIRVRALGRRLRNA